MSRPARSGCGSVTPFVPKPVGVRAGLSETITVPQLAFNPTFTTHIVTNTNAVYFEMTTPDTGPIRPLQPGVLMLEASIGNWDNTWADLRAFQFVSQGHTGTVRVGTVSTVNGAQVSNSGYFLPAAPVKITIRELWRITTFPANTGIGLQIVHLSGASRDLNLALYAWYLGIDP